MAATVWDDATRATAAYRLRHGFPADVDGIGPPPSFDTPEHNAWSQVSAHFAQTRTWLSTHDNEPVVLSRTRSRAELHQRQVRLEVIFATAPPDHRRLIDALATGQLTLDDVSQALDQALAAQGQRRDWILEHWPHIVEHAEITRTLSGHAAGPDLGPLLDQLALLDVTGRDGTNPRALLAAAARTNQAWLRVVLGHLAPPDADHVTPPVVELLIAVAAYRDRWHVTHLSPLGLAADTDEQARDLADLIQSIDGGLAVRDEPFPADHTTNRVPGPPVADLSL